MAQNSWFGPFIVALHAGPRRLVPMLMGGMLLSEPAGAQAPERLSDVVACSACRIEIEQRHSLGIPSDTHLEIPSLSVLRTARGDFIVTGYRDPPFMGRYGTDGRLLQRFGGRGQGPGEFLDPSVTISGLGDSIWVNDRQQRRLTLLDGQLRWVRDVQLLTLDIRSGALRSGLGDILLVGRQATSDGIGHPMHVLHGKAPSIRSFGGANQRVSPSNPYDELRHFALLSDGSVWVAHVNRYRLERWSARGVLLQSIELDAEWFRPWSENALPIHDIPKPAIAGVNVDEAGNLWVFTLVSAEGFRPRPRPTAPGREGGRIDFMDALKSYDTIVHVIQPGGAGVLASRRLPGALFVFPGRPATIARVEENARGDARVVVLEMVLTGIR